MTQLIDSQTFFDKRKEQLNTPKTDYNLDYIPAEVIAYKNSLNEQAAEIEHDTNYAALGGSIAVELGGGLYASHKLKTGKRYLNSLRNTKYAMNIFRGIQAANTATAGKSFTPWGAAAQIAGYGIAEAGIWTVSNFAGQKVRQAFGVQDQYYASEGMSAALFGVIAAPVEKTFEAAKIGQKLMPNQFKLNDGLVDLKAWKGREFFVNGTNKFISGAVLGLTESAFRQEIGLMLNERENRDVYDYLISGGVGGTLNSVLGMWSKTGAWGRSQESTMYSRVKKSVSDQIAEIDAQLNIKATSKTNRRALANKKRKLRLKKSELNGVLEIVNDMELKSKSSSEVAATQEVTPQGEVKQAERLPLEETATTPIKFTKQSARTFLSEIETGTGNIKNVVNKNPKLKEASIVNVRKNHGDTVRVYRVYTLGDGGKMRPDEVVSVTLNPSTVRALDGSMPEALISNKGTTTGQRVFRAYDVPVENVVADVKLLGDEAIKTLNQKSIKGKRNKVSIQDIQDTIDSEGELIVDLTGIKPINETKFGGGLERKIRKGANLVPKNKLEEFIEEDIKYKGYTFKNKEGKPTKDINEILAARDNNKEYFESVEKVIQFNKDFGIDAPTTPGTIDDYWSSLNKHLNETRDFSIKPVGADDPNRYLIIDNKTNKQVGRVERIIKDGEITFDQIAAKDADGNLIKGQGLVDTIYDHDFGYVNKNNLSGNVEPVSRKVLKEFDKRSDQVDIVSRTGENVADGVQIKFKGKQAKDIADTPTEGLTATQVDDLLEDFEATYQKAVVDGEESIVAETLVDKTRRIYDNADFDMENILDDIGKNPDNITPEKLTTLIDKVDIQIKLLNGIYGRLNALGGRVVRINNKDLSPTANSTFSQATELTAESLYQIKKRAEGMLGKTDDEFITEARKFVAKKDDTPPLTAKDDTPPVVKKETPGKAEGIDSKDATDTVDGVSKSLEKRIAKLQEQLESLYPNLGGKKLTMKQRGQKKKIDEDPKVKALKASIARAKKYKREADKIVELQNEAARLAKVSERDVPSEMKAEVTGKKKEKAPVLNPKLDDLKNQITAAKRLFRQRLKKIVDDENRLAQQQQNAELFEEIYSYVAREAEMEAIRPFFKGLRTVRMLRKLAMVNSLTSAQAAVPTGLFELVKLFPRAYASKIMALGKDNTTQRLALADFEAYLEGFKFLTDKNSFGQLFKHAQRTFKEGRDPNYNSATRFDDETFVSRNILPTGTAKIMRDASARAREASIGQEATVNWIKEKLRLGKFMEFMSLGARAIMATDAGFKRQLRFANARAEATKKAILANPNSANYREEADKIMDAWTKDKNGLGILGDIEELADGNRYIDEALLMTARTDNVQDVARNFTEEILVRPITKVLNDDSTKVGNLIGSALEALMPFYAVGVRSVSRMVKTANPLRGLGFLVNPYDDIIRRLEIEEGKFKILVKNRMKRGQTKQANQAATQVRQLKERIRIAEGRRVRHNKEVLTDVIVQASFGSAAFIAGYYGHATGTNAWMTADQKRKNPNKGAYKMFGMDYRAAVPVNLLMALAADAGNFMRAREQGQVSKKMGELQVMLNSAAATMADLPLAQGVKDVQNIFRENHDFEASVSEVVSSYIPIPSQVKKIVRKITSGDSMADLRGGSFADRSIYHIFGIAPPNRRVDILGQFKESTKTWGHTINRFATDKEIKYQPYQERIASDHDAVLQADLPKSLDGIPRGQDMSSFIDEDGRTLHQHFALRLQQTDIVEKVNEFVTSPSFFELYGLTIDNGESSKNQGLVAMKSMINSYYNQVKAEMLSDTSFLSRFVNDKDEKLQTLIETNKVVNEINFPKPL